MIKNVEIHNFFGIKKYSVDFRIKSLQGQNGLEEQVINADGENIALLPTFIAKNAAGKTSFIKAINFALRFASKETFIKEVFYYTNRIAMQKFVSNSFDNTGEIELKRNISQGIIKDLFDEVSFAGSDFCKLKIQLVKNREIELELTSDSFFITMNNTTINLGDFISKIEYKINLVDFTSPLELRKIVIDIINKQIDKSGYEFFTGVNNASLFKGDHKASEFNAVKLKNFTGSQMRKIIESFGFSAFKTLLTKIDNNVKTINFDQETKSLEIMINGTDVPITPKNLSFGTQKIIEIIYKSINLFNNGGIMLIDEIENGLHISLIKLITTMYSDPDINIKGAQLFITTHSPSIFEEDIVDYHNVFVSNNDKFISLKEENKCSTNSRTENIKAMIKTKNYFNDFF